MGVSLSASNLGRSAFTFSTGDWARQANGSVVTSYGDTVVLATVCASKEPQEKGFLPLTVEYQERTYAMGKIPGGFIKREGRPKDSEILSARLIDRPLRPLFPAGLTNEIQIVAMVLSSDAQNDPDVLAINAASCALLISDIPFDVPVGAVRVSKIDNTLIINPTYEEREKSGTDFVVAGTEKKIVMLEGNFNELKEQEALDIIKFAHPFINEIIALQKSLQKKIGKEKKNYPLSTVNQELLDSVKNKINKKLETIYGIVHKEEREAAVRELIASLHEEKLKEDPEITQEDIAGVFEVLEDGFLRKKIMEEEKRPDGRGLKDIRPIECKVRVLPRTHGSAVFTRGQTQSLAVTTLGTSSDVQHIEALEGEQSKHFMLHYIFPPFSVGEIKPMRGPSRRDIGHGALAEKALLSVIPCREDFPYTIRLVSEILESNGSSSMATVCASSLSLMDAGVPVKSPVAGIAMGLVSEGERFKILTDIAGIEDHHGEMDFKIAGTEKGINAIQLDIKSEGLSYEVIEAALSRAKEARLTILGKMNAALSTSRSSVSQYAPRIKTFKIDSEKIGAVIGPGGKIIRRISRENNATIDIDDEAGTVSVTAYTQEELERVVKIVVNLTKDIEPGEVFEGKITRIANFGAFCEILPGKQGLIHVSEIADTYVKDVRDFLKEGDIVKVKVIGIDNQGKINLSMKQVEP
ncbi:MAG: polyribonucleotide nucleotidyltransferase [Candidatus Omnitrophica bacterium]|nr:polyribonucleotide nucleotidyltransferase [Candidatus Omnitrophota bacterium]